MIVLHLSQKILVIETWSFSGAWKLVLGFLPSSTLASSFHPSPFSSKTKTILRYPIIIYCNLFEPIITIFDPLDFFAPIPSHAPPPQRRRLARTGQELSSPVKRFTEKKYEKLFATPSIPAPSVLCVPFVPFRRYTLA